MASPTSPNSVQSPVPAAIITTKKEPEYYAKIDQGLADKVKDFDDPVQFNVLLEAAKISSTQNFVLDYGAQEAWFMADLPETSLVKLARQPAPPVSNSRWIQIWYPHLQVNAIRALSAKYSFSPRLTALMQDKPSARSPAAAPEPDYNTHGDHSTAYKITSAISGKFSFDAEKAFPNAHVRARRDSGELLRSLGHYDIVNSIWHWSSIDVGPKYICLGYNALHQVVPGSSQNPYDLPDGLRIWNWLVLCDDDTVISIVESPLEPPSPPEPVSRSRKNFLNVLEQLSMSFPDLHNRNPISIVPIRLLLSQEQIGSTDAAGLLFFYLFDDWYSTYPLLVKSGHQYGAELNRVREKMLGRASLEHVNQLYSIGRQLALLKRVYQSYELLIDKILEKYNKKSEMEQLATRQNSTTADEWNMQRITSYQRDRVDVRLSPDALVRFERLRDRIRLYVISEIQECLDIKDSLLAMVNFSLVPRLSLHTHVYDANTFIQNFNLITIKESNAVERLTRITILLAKATILFLPVSLMTAYFSINMEGIKYTIAQFWVSFAVILVVSFLGLLTFGKISGTTEGDMIYKPINKVMLGIVRAFLGRSQKPT